MEMHPADHAALLQTIHARMHQTLHGHQAPPTVAHPGLATHGAVEQLLSAHLITALLRARAHQHNAGSRPIPQ